MEVLSKPCQDWFLYLILIRYKKIQLAKWGTPKKFKKKLFVMVKKQFVGYSISNGGHTNFKGESKTTEVNVMVIHKKGHTLSVFCHFGLEIVVIISLCYTFSRQYTTATSFIVRLTWPIWTRLSFGKLAHLPPLACKYLYLNCSNL